MAKNQKDISVFLSYKILMSDLAEIQRLLKSEGFVREQTKRRIDYVNEAAFSLVLIIHKLSRTLLARKALSSKDALPPSSALLSALLPTSMSEDVIENLNELFHEKWLARHGSRIARRIWRAQAAHIVLKYWLGPITALLDRIGRLKTGG